MFPMDKVNVVSSLRRLRPTAKLPAAAVLDAFPAADRRLLRRRVTEPVECVFDPRFEEPSAWVGNGGTGTKRVGSNHEASVVSAAVSDNNDSGAGMLAPDGTPSADVCQEPNAFQRLNYCRYRVMRIMEEHAGKRLSPEAAGEILRWEHAAAELREGIVRANVPLVLAMAKRTRVSGVDFSDLVSEGSMALLRSVEKFDSARGYQFSTYACRAILKSFSRVAARAARHRGHFPAEFDPALEKGDVLARKRDGVENDCVAELRSILGENLASLTDIEEQVIRARFALEASGGNDGRLYGKTLEQVGAQIGVTKERVRQIQNKALGKLRQILEQDILTG
jgi:RNA polymerase primary sigma factor